MRALLEVHHGHRRPQFPHRLPAARLKAYATAAVMLALDRLSKWIVESNVSSMDTVPVIPGLFNIVRSENRGMAFGILNDSTSDWPTTLLIVLSAAAVVFVAAM